MFSGCLVAWLLVLVFVGVLFGDQGEGLVWKRSIFVVSLLLEFGRFFFYGREGG